MRRGRGDYAAHRVVPGFLAQSSLVHWFGGGGIYGLGSAGLSG